MKLETLKEETCLKASKIESRNYRKSKPALKQEGKPETKKNETKFKTRKSKQT